MVPKIRPFNPDMLIWCRRDGSFRTKQEQDEFLKRREKRVKYKKAVFEEYGGECACCGLKDWRFLTIDHTNNDGKEHRKTMKADIYKWLVDNGFPFQFQILCFNCNCAKEINGGVCPHKQDKK